MQGARPRGVSRQVPGRVPGRAFPGGGRGGLRSKPMEVLPKLRTPQESRPAMNALYESKKKTPSEAAAMLRTRDMLAAMVMVRGATIIQGSCEDVRCNQAVQDAYLGGSDVCLM